MVRLVSSAVALLAAMIVSTAVAARTVVYAGTATFQSFSTLGTPVPGLYTGPATFRGIFYYDAQLNPTGAAIEVAGVVRKTFRCPTPTGFCGPLHVGATHVSSGVGTTPEDGMTLSVDAPGGFGVDLLGTAAAAYDLVPGDDSNAFVTWSPYDGPLGYAYSVGDGLVSRVTSTVPEPAAWGLMIAGFGLVGVGARRRAVAD